MKMFMDGPNWTKAVIGLVLLAVAGVAGAKEHCYPLPEDVRVEICWSFDAGVSIVETSPLGWKTRSKVNQDLASQRNTCDPLQCGFYAARRCITHHGVRMAAWIDDPNIEPLPTCVTMCGDGAFYKDECLNSANPNPDPPSTLPDCSGECPGACAESCLCCEDCGPDFPDCNNPT